MTAPFVRSSLSICVFFILSSPAVGHAQQNELRQVPPCSGSEYRQFDFWLGKWSVETPDGKTAGTNEITQILSGCALREEWTGVTGSRGTSYSMFDARSGLWHQTWVDNGGLLLVLDGKFEDGKMVLHGTKQSGDSLTVMHEISWEPIEGGRVVQRWTTSRDRGTTWQVVFESIYLPLDDR